MNNAHALLALRIIIGTLVVLILCCLFILLPELRSRFILWRERRAIAKRDAAEAKRRADAAKWNILVFPREQRATRIARDDLDPARRTGQFRVPSSTRDQKGLWR